MERIVNDSKHTSVSIRASHTTDGTRWIDTDGHAGGRLVCSYDLHDYEDGRRRGWFTY